MVFFSCNACGESLKKNQVEKHSYRCRGPFSCLDCQLVFDGRSYNSHLKCISEAQKYGGKGFVQKENKGEAKQEAWCEQVERAIGGVQDPQLKGLLKQIAGYANIPRKEAKFINFLVNSIRVRQRDLCVKAWAAIAAEAAKIKLEEEAAKKAEIDAKAAEKSTEAADAEEASGETSSQDEKKNKAKANGEKDDEGTKDFKWKATIKRKLRESGGEMRVKKLRTAVLEEYAAVGGEIDADDEGLFARKLASAGVVVDGKKATLA